MISALEWVGQKPRSTTGDPYLAGKWDFHPSKLQLESRQAHPSALSVAYLPKVDVVYHGLSCYFNMVHQTLAGFPLDYNYMERNSEPKQNQVTKVMQKMSYCTCQGYKWVHKAIKL